MNRWVFQGANELTSKELRSFVGGAIVETLFFLISVVGYVRDILILTFTLMRGLLCSLIGAIVRKLTFVTAYAIGLYIHFLINLIVAGYLLFVILHATRTDATALCQHALKNAQTQSQCESLFDTIRSLYAGLATFLLIVELCECPRTIPPPVAIRNSTHPPHSLLYSERI